MRGLRLLDSHPFRDKTAERMGHPAAAPQSVTVMRMVFDRIAILCG